MLTAEHSRLSALVATTERLWRSSTARLRRAYPYPESIRSSRIGGHRGHEAGPCTSARRTDLAIDHRDPFRITEGMGRGGGLTVLFSYYIPLFTLLLSYSLTLLFSYSLSVLLSYSHTLLLSYSLTLLLSYSPTLLLCYSLSLLLVSFSYSATLSRSSLRAQMRIWGRSTRL